MKKLIVIALAMVLLLVSSAALGACGTGISQEDYDAVVAERDVAEAQIASLQAALDAAELDAAQSQAAVLQVTAKYLDVEVALADGYVPVGPCVSAPLGGMGIHYVNPGLVYAPINLLTPAVLLYVPTEDGLKLIGVEYIGEALAADNLAPWFMKEIPPDGWATSAPTLFGQSFSGPIPGHTLDEPWHYDLHVWLWEENPSGMFADFNPNVSCPE